MRNSVLDEALAGIKIARRNTNNLRYGDDTTLMAESEEELFPFSTPLKILVSPWAVAPPGVTGIGRTSCAQSPASAEVSLMLRSTSSTWGIRKPKWMSSHSVATWCHMSMSSSPLKPGGCAYLCQQVHGEKLWQRWFSHPSAAPPLPCHPHQQDVVLRWS